MTKSSHAARLFLPLVISLGGTAYGQLRPRPQSPSTNTTPVITQPLSKTKPNATINPSMTSAPTEVMQKAFREVIGRDPFRDELSGVTKYVLNGVTFNCIPPSHIAEFDPPPKVKRREWNCRNPIMDWLHDTPAGQAEYRAVYARAFKEVFGLDAKPLSLLKVKPQKDAFGVVGHQDLLNQFTNRIYGKSSSPFGDPPSPGLEALVESEGGAGCAGCVGGDSGEGHRVLPEGNTATPVKHPLSLEATIERAFLHALNRKPTEADMKAVIPVFEKESATHRRMVEILKGLDSLKNLKL